MRDYAQRAKRNILLVLFNSMALVTTPSAASDLGSVDWTTLAEYSAAELRIVTPPANTADMVVRSKREDRLEFGKADQVLAQNRPPLRGGPPQEAIAACHGVADSGACAFSDANGTAISGSCRPGPRGEPAACIPASPAGRPGGSGQRP